MSKGMNSKSGRWINDYAHLSQSLGKIVTTPIGSRLERREFGSLIPDLIDSPADPRRVLLIYAATVTAIMKHEPRLRVTRISSEFFNPSNPRVELTIEGSITEGFEDDQQLEFTVAL